MLACVGAFGKSTALKVLAGSAAIGLLMSTQFLFQSFVWRNWTVVEVMLGWVDVARDNVVVTLAIGLSVVAGGAIRARGQVARSSILGVTILVGAACGEVALGVLDSEGAARDVAALLGRVARWGIVAGSIAAMWYLSRRVAEADAAAHAAGLRRAQLERQATEARLEALRSQIEPHFLFNTLATVRRLHQVEPQQGARLLRHFVDYLRSAQLSRRAEVTTLGQEIDLTRAYLGVVAMRMTGRLEVSLDVPQALRPHVFPPLTIATLVENAIKHGIAPAPAGGTIAISVRHTGNCLEAEVADTGVGFSGSSGTGIGLANIRARLVTLYGGGATLTLRANVPHGVRATMRLPFLPASDAA
jgi:two-component sensor histidine kinase